MKIKETQFVEVRAEGEAALPVGGVCRKHWISNATYYQWKSNYSGMSISELKRVEELGAEISRRKRLHGDLAPENSALKDVFVSKVLTPAVKRAAVEIMPRTLTENSLASRRPRDWEAYGTPP